ncbi:tetratricopeptide repeat protein [Sphingobacterium spiritivorum]|uniref:tetratricopeptide repeat protein n=1 Tax=Sphingobacterium spiritivorum TaxID=258 RepID=UPI00191AD717|nr:tetratricopeptide repeat protein [Sphingobacterium spiritivorum]QQT25522.1 tetratricopeptide repeat protein [Sphingobacterium spiritivorum]
MRTAIQQEAWQALHDGNYAVAAKNWIQGHSLPENHTALKELYYTLINLTEVSPNPDLFAILGLIALDTNEIFNSDREEALIQCVQWSKAGIALDPDHYSCNRHAGSALYWLDDKEAAAKYYEKAAAIKSSPTLQIRIFNIHNRNNPAPDFSTLHIDLNTDEAMELYNAGVEINYILTQYAEIQKPEIDRLAALKINCYEEAYSLYRQTIVEKSGNPLHEDPHTFAMCCTNLAVEMRQLGQFDKAVDITTEGMHYSYFMAILQNRFGAYVELENSMEVVKDGEQLIDDFAEQMDLQTYFSTIDHICNAFMQLKNYEEALEWISLGQEEYYALDLSDPISSDPEIVRCFTNFFIYKANAETASGITPDTATAAKETDAILEEMPDNPSILISRANIFIEEGNFDKAIECYQYAIHLASERDAIRSVQVAFYNMGYLYVAYKRDDEAALDCFEQSIAMGNADFWCGYWATHCSYHLTENEKTIFYANSAIQALPQQEGVTGDIIAELYEHLGSAQLDLELYTEAAQNYRESLRYNFNQMVSDNLKVAEENIKSSGSNNFFSKLFGK